jgi:hypothetical protein
MKNDLLIQYNLFLKEAFRCQFEEEEEEEEEESIN